jgi:putative PIN family toxin of toxin-antitoxin system
VSNPALVVLDTNLVLDLFVFKDPAVATLKTALSSGELTWISTEAMQLELSRVLTYGHITKALDHKQLVAKEVEELAFSLGKLVPVPPPASHGVRCRDRDDQIFVDLAVAHQASLLSKDKAVLALKNPLKRWNVSVLRRWP